MGHENVYYTRSSGFPFAFKNRRMAAGPVCPFSIWLTWSIFCCHTHLLISFVIGIVLYIQDRERLISMQLTHWAIFIATYYKSLIIWQQQQQ